MMTLRPAEPHEQLEWDLGFLEIEWAEETPKGLLIAATIPVLCLPEQGHRAEGSTNTCCLDCSWQVTRDGDHWIAFAAPVVACAYCGNLTPPEQQASAPWLWPGRGIVTNCKSCAGIVACAVHDDCEYDSTIVDECQLARAEQWFREEAAATTQLSEPPRSELWMAALELLRELGYLPEPGGAAQSPA